MCTCRHLKEDFLARHKQSSYDQLLKSALNTSLNEIGLKSLPERINSITTLPGILIALFAS